MDWIYLVLTPVIALLIFWVYSLQQECKKLEKQHRREMSVVNSRNKSLELENSELKKAHYSLQRLYRKSYPRKD